MDSVMKGNKVALRKVTEQLIWKLMSQCWSMIAYCTWNLASNRHKEMDACLLNCSNCIFLFDTEYFKKKIIKQPRILMRILKIRF